MRPASSSATETCSRQVPTLGVRRLMTSTSLALQQSKDPEPPAARCFLAPCLLGAGFALVRHAAGSLELVPNMIILESGIHSFPTTTTTTITAHRLDPMLKELDAKLAACTGEEDTSQLSSAVAERETRVIGVYRQVSKASSRWSWPVFTEGGARLGWKDKNGHTSLGAVALCAFMVYVWFRRKGGARPNGGSHSSFFLFCLERRGCFGYERVAPRVRG